MRTLNQDTLYKVDTYIKEYQLRNGESPSYRDIQRGVGMSSPYLVQRYVLALEGQGRISRNSDGRIKLPMERTGKTALSQAQSDLVETVLQDEKIADKFDKTIFTKLIDKVKVKNRYEIIFVFKNGVEIKAKNE